LAQVAPFRFCSDQNEPWEGLHHEEDQAGEMTTACVAANDVGIMTLQIGSGDVDVALERVLRSVEEDVDRAMNIYEEALGGNAAMLESDSFKVEESLTEELSVLRRAGEEESLSEMVLDIFDQHLRMRAVPQLWRSVAGQTKARGDPAVLPTGWEERLHAGFVALRKLQQLHVEVLETLRLEQPSAIAEYRLLLRAAVRESWPRGLAQQVQAYLAETWDSALRVLPGRRKEDAEEWWWIGPDDKAEPKGVTDRMLCLLDPNRRPRVPGRSTGSRAVAQAAHDTEASPMEEAGDDLMEVSAAEDDDDVCMADQRGLQRHEANIARFEALSEAMWDLGLGDIWQDMAMQSLLQEQKLRAELEEYTEVVNCSVLQKMMRRLHNLVLPWLRMVFALPVHAAPTLPYDEEKLGVEDAWWMAARRTVVHFLELFLEVRLRQAFDMVKEFPDSIPALLDLRRCLARTGNTGLLVQALRTQLSRRLLIAGAHTRDVIKVYIKTIKAMRLIDPRGLLLEAVSPPTRAYLRRRKDTVRCIITALTEDSDLQKELQSGAEAQRQAAESVQPQEGARPTTASDGAAAVPPASGAQSRTTERAVQGSDQFDWVFSGGDFDISEDEDPDSWKPDPLDTDPFTPSRHHRRAQDVVSLLVGIYGSKEMFIKEYKEMLADRLLGAASYGTEREAQNLELLKTRFGEAALTHCEVMLQDIKDSRRVNMNIHRQLSEGKPQAGAAVLQRAPLGPQASGGTMDVSTSSQNSRQLPAPFSLSSIFGASDGFVGASGLVLGESEASDALPLPPTVAGQRVPLEQMQALVLSKHYWPSALAKEDYPNLRLPTVLEQSLNEYSSMYSKIRAKRSLMWKRTHGLVEVTVELKDRSLSVVVGPVHLAVLSCFTDDAQDAESSTLSTGAAGSSGRQNAPCVKSLQEVAAALELPEALVRKRIGFWVSKEVLREVSSGVFEVQESGSAVDQHGGRGLDDEAEPTGASSSAAEMGMACSGELEACEALLHGIFTNHTSLSLSRVHNFLQMFMMDPPYTQTEAQLGNFLTRLCREGRLDYNGSVYSLARKA